MFFILGGLFVYFVFIPSLSTVNTDFPNYYVSSKMYLDGKDLKIAYDNVEFNRLLLLYGINGQIVSFVPYPPLTALLMLPIASFTPLEAKLIWNFFNLALFAVCILLLAKITDVDFFTCGIIFFLSGFALANNFIFGQVYLLVLLFLLLFMFFLKNDRGLPAAFFLALSIVLKFYTVFFLFLLLFRKQYRPILYTMAFSLAIYIPAVLITGVDLNVFYFSEIMPRLGEGWVGTVYAAEYQSFTSLIHRWFSFEPMLNPNPLVQSSLAFYTLKNLFLFLILAFCAALIKPAAKDMLTALSLFCIVSLLLLPVNASYQFVVLVPAVVILFNYYSKNEKYIPAVLLVLVMFFMNSHIQVFTTDYFKNTSLYILAYLKLIGLTIFFSLNLKILHDLNNIKLFRPQAFRIFAAAGLCAAAFTVFSLIFHKPVNDNAKYVPTGNNYLVSMPSAIGNRLVWTECINDKFVLRSNFGFSYDKNNVFYPLFTDSNHIVYETIENQTLKQKIINTESGIEKDTSGILLNLGSLNSTGTAECFSSGGKIILHDLTSGIKIPLTSGKQFCYFPVFENDSTIIFTSDRKRGVGFTALYKLNINGIK